MKNEPRSKSRVFKWVESLLAGPATEACIEWPFSKRATGYGQIFYCGKRTTSNRLICEMANGPAPFEGAHAAHECGNRSCCNPGHIVWKSPKENAADKSRHGTQPHGEQAYNHKLTEDDVVGIRDLCKKGLTLSEVGQLYGIAFQSVSDIKLRKMWKHVQ